MEVSFPTDSDGFLSQECPSCEQRFKVLPGQGSEEPISFCPYCRYNDQNCWFTQEQVSHMQAVATDVIVAPELKKLERQVKGSAGGFLSVSVKTDLSKPSSPPMEIDDPFEILHFPCCQETVKLNRQQIHFCIICGTEVDMTINEAKRVFLSHKGVNKDLVIDFKETLKLLGYEPWLDEDAMPAGTPLERGLLQGMKDSCGVVFFVTPEFKDEGYLESEIDYAIQQKRLKGDRFAIVTLQFPGDNGKAAPIPDLLQTYIWKTPKTHLEALREMVRALPVAPGPVDWRDEVTGVATVPQTKSTTSELSDEAKEILREAATGNGSIMHIRLLNGDVISVNGKSMLEDTDRRTIASWVGGLEDLQKRRYIKDIGHKGEVFEVTREGYDAADELGLSQPNPSRSADV